MRQLPEGLPARMAAIDRVNDVLSGREQTGRNRYSKPNLGPAEKATARRLEKLVYRNLARSDCVLDGYMKSMPPTLVLNVMRLAVCEFFAESAPPWTVVDQAVKQLKFRSVDRSLQGLANAVLRKVVTGSDKVWQASRTQRLPRSLETPMIAAYGGAAVEMMNRMYSSEPPVDITPRQEGDGERLTSLLDGDLLPTGSVRMHDPVQISAMPEYDQGSWWVQDAAAAIPVNMVRDLEGKRVLDLCSAPGGKAMQCMSRGAMVDLVDISSRRIRVLKENLQRTGLSGNIIHADALTFKSSREYDLVIVDPPCTSTGTIRRHPELPFRLELDAAMLARNRGVQRSLLDRALSLAGAQGLVLYCVCSLLPGEGEQLMEDYITNRPVEVVDCEFAGSEPGWKTTDGGVRLRPDYWMDRGGMDGFYAVVLKKTQVLG